MAKKNSRPPTPEVCPVCGEDVPKHCLACPECGADRETGWKEDAEGGAAGIGDDEFDYEEFTRREFGSSPKPHGIGAVWWLTAIILVLFGIWYLVKGSRLPW